MSRLIKFASVLFCSSVLMAAENPPNILIFYADDMGHGDVGSYGCQDIQTPHIDALARNGVRFTNYYSAAPVCAPSRAALLTGRYPIRAGVPNNVSSSPGSKGMAPDEVTLAEVARSRGYATALIGKWHLGFSDGTRPNDQGFDYFFGHHAGCIDYYSHMFYWQTPHHHDLYRNREEIHAEGRYMTDLIAEEAIQFIDRHHQRPFLLYVPFNAPHYPMQAPRRFREMYAHLPQQRADYAALVAGLDEAVGRVMDRLSGYDLQRKTLVFFASDNGATVEARANYGGGSNHPFREYKFSLFEGGIHMPAIISWPGTLPQGEQRDQLAIAMDLLPTVAEIIGADLTEDRTIDGKSWLPLLEEDQRPGHETLFFAMGDQAAVRQGRWKLVHNGLVMTKPGKMEPATGEDALFLADLEADPGETRNLKQEHPEQVERLLEMHRDWLREIKNK